MGAVARARSFDGDRDSLCHGRITERSNVLHPGFFVEICGQEPAGFIWQHRIDASGEIQGGAGCSTGQVRSQRLITERDECLIRALSAFDLRFATHTSDPLIAADRCITRPARVAVFPPTREHVFPSPEQAPKECDLIGARRSHGYWRGDLSRFGRCIGLHVMQRGQLCGDFRPLKIECSQTAGQSGDLSRDVIRGGDGATPFWPCACPERHHRTICPKSYAKRRARTNRRLWWRAPPPQWRQRSWRSQARAPSSWSQRNAALTSAPL